MADDPPPSDVYVDTSIAVAAMFEGTAHSAASVTFCARLEAARSRVVFSEILWLELSQVLARQYQDPRLPEELRRTYRLDRWETDARVRTRWLAFGLQQFEMLIARFRDVSAISFDRDIWDASIDIMAQTNLRSHDAIHVATARSAGIADFATIDHHFRRMPGLNVWLIRDSAH